MSFRKHRKTLFSKFFKDSSFPGCCYFRREGLQTISVYETFAGHDMTEGLLVSNGGRVVGAMRLGQSVAAGRSPVLEELSVGETMKCVLTFPARLYFKSATETNRRGPPSGMFDGFQSKWRENICICAGQARFHFIMVSFDILEKS